MKGERMGSGWFSYVIGNFEYIFFDKRLKYGCLKLGRVLNNKNLR